mmetsp:Transcript_14710/g.39392  ORF Transcript_14710/g.39392 Transcript_14710/m.39392 type:complete len:241 (-) Transcript_14710:820-1542(-)
MIHDRVQVRAEMYRLEQMAIDTELVQHGVADVAGIVGLCGDRLRVRREALSRDAVVVQYAPVLVAVAVGVPKCEQRVADHDIVGRRVVVQLLMPLLHHATVAPAAVVPQDHQNVIADALAKVAPATASDARHCHANIPPLSALFAELLRQLCYKAHLRRGKLSRLRVVVSLPIKHTQLRVAHPDVQRGPTVGVVTCDRVHHVLSMPVAVHQRPRSVLHLLLDDVLRKLCCRLAHLLVESR